jgi:hypothetical protein
MANASKNKGKSWEREIAKHLTSIYGVNFQRVPNSGAFVGGYNANRISTLTPEQLLLASGDIILPRFLSHITLEGKFYKDFNFESLLTENKQLNEWIKQASVIGKIPFVLFKINRKGGFVVFPMHIMKQLIIDGNFLIYWMTEKESTAAGSYVVVKMEGFFEKNKNQIVALNEENYKLYANAFLQNTTQSNIS